MGAARGVRIVGWRNHRRPAKNAPGPRDGFARAVPARRFRVSTAPLLAAVALALAAPLAHSASSRFDAGTEGWTAIGDFAAPLSWSATGGNPGGHVFIPDQVIGGVTYFVAPSAFLGDQSAAFGTLLRFDLRQDFPGAANPFDERDVVLTGGGLTLVYDTSPNPPNGGWASYAVPLSAGGWRVGTLSGALATDGQMVSVLSGLTQLLIRAEFQTGSDTGRLDNVSLVPEPGSALLFAGGLAALAGWRRGRSRRG